ncbi:OadG family protein [Anaerosinus gibii]|uniref:OadG family protein n=1 Tax=Selenobaculum gibii TaxID=3054208 RepID=A0A9Y2AH54_9FIRM|nr:OadG family protein [Selenobaculum gbiensis]WIW69989.1 OadG family protein [Selenobaculum gbiensis]
MNGEPVTTNPFLIMLINMTIVFGVLWLLGCMIKFIHFIDPTKKKNTEKIISTAPMQPATVVVSEDDLPDKLQEKELVAVITTAIMAYGYRDVRITSIKEIHD